MKHLSRIVIDPTIRFGKPCVTHEDVLACFGFAAERERRLLALPAA